MIQGERSQAKDFTGCSGEEQFLSIGGAYHMEYGDGRNGGTADYHAHTIDARWENGPLNLFAAYIGATIDPDSSGTPERDMTGFVVQGGVHIVPDKLELFGQWFYIDGDVSGEDEFDGCVAGVNYYINGHRTKFTADVIWLNETLPTANPFGASAASSGLGLIAGDEDEMALNRQENPNGNEQQSKPQSNGNTPRNSDGMTQSQHRAIDDICKRLDTNPTDEARHEFGLDLDRMTIREASKLIDHLKSLQPAGNGDGRHRGETRSRAKVWQTDESTHLMDRHLLQHLADTSACPSPAPAGKWAYLLQRVPQSVCRANRIPWLLG